MVHYIGTFKHSVHGTAYLYQRDHYVYELDLPTVGISEVYRMPIEEVRNCLLVEGFHEVRVQPTER